MSATATAEMLVDLKAIHKQELKAFFRAPDFQRYEDKPLRGEVLYVA